MNTRPLQIRTKPGQNPDKSGQSDGCPVSGSLKGISGRTTGVSGQPSDSDSADGRSKETLAQLLLELRAARQERFAAEGREKVARDAVLNLVGRVEVDRDVPGIGPVAIVMRVRVSLDSRRIRDERPEVWAKYSRSTDYWIVKIGTEEG